MDARITSKGQVTIPKACRDELGLREGTVLEFGAVDGVLVARKRQPEDPFTRWRGRGRLPGGGTVDEYLKAIRG